MRLVSLSRNREFCHCNRVDSDKFRRFLHALFENKPVVVVTALGAILTGATNGWPLTTIVIVSGLVCFASLVAKEYTHATYDPLLSERLREKFNGMLKDRVRASKYLLGTDTSEASRDGLVSILEFFERVGFDVVHRANTAENVHQDFFDYVMAYCGSKAATKYVENDRKTDPLIWEHLPPLVKRLRGVELFKCRRFKVDYTKYKWNSFNFDKSALEALKAESETSQ